ncbi:sensor histidine kinase [Paraburkholderia kururiensis]|uniref:Histidine kinase n=1 Tax=Paraburkholderia kururiensis TaxID=984307 RepID=A0ABZ0WGH2_9BURK|nr:ATP-binding protein [Paraburkholderia kururiensis]WQD76382.1 histidine kinase [Paraburkholderia kururiensis]
MDTSTVIPISGSVPARPKRAARGTPAADMRTLAPGDPPSLAVTAAAATPLQANGVSELVRLRTRVNALAAELAAVGEATRRQLARELHDSVGAELTATHFALANLETRLADHAPQAALEAFALVRRSLEATGDAVRQALAGLHAPQLDAGIVRALSQWTGGFAQRTGLRTSLVCAADVRLTRLPPASALAVFRVAQEALTNVARHAQATGADVQIETSRRYLTLIVSDDGVGLSPRAARRCRSAVDHDDAEFDGHFGVSGMRVRCEAFGGKLQIMAKRLGATAIATTAAGRPKHGTRLRARFAWDALMGAVPAQASAVCQAKVLR